ncbi:MAG TPA: hypothetical protein VML50_14895 [Anaeromyxobacter sp.]|nr:hypothetical protein [Anaeromyxobacter sp.]
MVHEAPRRTAPIREDPTEAKVAKLALVKGLHTAVWAFFAGCIVALPAVALAGELRLAAWLAGAVLVEVAVLAANRWRCPLTGIAARYTDDRGDSFDVYLPRWLARYNKQVFGTLFVAGGLVTLWAWLR